MIPIDRTVILVDGRTEMLALNDRFKVDLGVVPGLRQVRCNGRCVSAKCYVEHALPTIRVALSDRFAKVICVLDREQRAQHASTFAGEIRKLLISALVANKIGKESDLNNAIFVCVADRMFENWIVADVAGLRMHQRTLIQANAKQKNYEGQSGTTALKRIMAVEYCKCTHAPLLFRSIRFPNARQNSVSFDSFCRAVALI